MSIIVYWLETRTATDPTPQACCTEFEDTDLNGALKQAELVRKLGCKHVSISSDPTAMVGGFGVDAVADGKLPDGTEYGWKKRRD